MTVNARVGAILAIAMAMAIATARSRSRAQEPAAGERWVELISIDGSINPAVTDYVDDSIAAASGDGASALIIQLDTPGGLLASAQHIVKTLLNAPLPTICYIAPSGAGAASAGTFIVEAANIAAMAPGTTIGAAHPVEEGGADIRGVMGQKVENFTASFARSIAQQRGRNQDWIEQAVRRSVVIGEREALQKQVIDIVARDLASLLAQASGRRVNVNGRDITLDLAGAEIRTGHMSVGQRVLNTLSDPNIVYLLLMAGLIGLYFEFAHPGVFLPGVAGAICLLLALASFEVLPVNLTGLLLILLGIGMLVAEVYVTSYGILGLGGIIAFVMGSLLFIDTSRTNLVVSRNIIYGAAAGSALIILGVGYLVSRDRRSRARTGAEGLVGEIGEVREAIVPGMSGKVFVHGEIWRAVSGEALPAGAQARVTAVRGLEVVVQRSS